MAPDAIAIQSWLPGYTEDDETRLRLFCFPYAGGGASLFRRWNATFSSICQVCPVQLPGRENRRLEPACDNLETLVKRLAEVLEPGLVSVPAFAFFGYSMGGLLSFELARYLARHYELKPAILFIAACRAPELINCGKLIYQLPDGEFLESLQQRFGGLPAELRATPELLVPYTGLLRADMTLVETYRYWPAPPLECPIAAFGGQDDPAISYIELKGWERHSEVGFSLRRLPGGHLFIRSAEDLLLNYIRADLNRLF